MSVAGIVDLRSDTITHPTERMRDAMRAAEVGDDSYGEDPTVTQLEHLAAERVGMQAYPAGPSIGSSRVLVRAGQSVQVLLRGGEEERSEHAAPVSGSQPMKERE